MNQHTPHVAISADCHVYLVGRQEAEIFSKYKSFLKDNLRARYDAERSAWRIQAHQIDLVAKHFEGMGFSVTMPKGPISCVVPKPEVKLRFAEGKIRFRCCERSETFNDVFNNKLGLLTGITEYIPETYERATTSFYLAKEAIGVLEDKGFRVVADETYTKTLAFWQAREDGFRTMDPEIAALLPFELSLFHHQNKAIARIEKAQGKFLLGAAMGCIDGEAIVTVMRAGGSRKMKLKDLHEKFHGGKSGRWGGDYEGWDLTIPTSIRCFFQGYLKSMPIQDTFYRGKKPTVKLTLDDGKVLVATHDHRILTDDGWVQAQNCLGKTVMTNGILACRECGSTHKVTTYIYAKYPGICVSCIGKFRATNEGTVSGDGYRYIKVRKHPNRSDVRGNLGIGQHRLVIEADLNHVSYEEWIRIVRESNDLSGYTFVEKDVHIHHKNGNKLDNRLENLEILSAKVHLTLHGEIDHLPIFKPKKAKCVGVEENGEIDVYDVHVPFAETFVANGIIVHNSGKTIIALAYAAKHRLRVCIVCPKVVRRTWLKEAQKFFPSCFPNGMELDKRKGPFRLEGMDIVSVNYEGLTKWSSDIIEGQFDMLVVDECFTGDTEVDTPSGKRRIDALRIGDEVLNCSGVDHVIALGSRFSESSIVINGIECTENHPFLTMNGWVQAKDIKKGDYLVSRNKAMRIVREDVRCGTQRQTLLRNLLLCEMEDESARIQRKGDKSKDERDGKISETGQKEPRSFRVVEESQSDAFSRIERKDDSNFEREESQAKKTRWEWDRNVRSGNGIIQKAGRGLDFTVRYCYDATRKWKEKISTPIQVRLWKRKIEGSHRGGWNISQDAREESARFAQETIGGVVRVESVEHIKHASKRYFNIGVAKHPSYSVNGILVHNCHYCKNPDSARTSALLKLSKHFEHRLLLSGTAIKNKREELQPQLEMLDAETFGPSSGLFSAPTGAFWHGIQSIYMAMPKAEVLPFLPAKTVRRHDVAVDEPVDLPASIEEVMLFKHKCAMSKLPITIEKIRYILDNSDDAILVFSEFVDVAQELHREFKNSSLYHDGQMLNEKREAVKESFQSPDGPRILVSTRPSLAVGATLTRASNVIFNDLPWNPADIDQGADRTHRIGQHKPVSVYWIIAENSAFDMRLIDLISQKYAIQKAVTEGKQVSKEELEFLAKPISFRELLKGAK